MQLDSDPVVSTLDIQYHAWRDGGLHILSYPLRPSYRPPELPSGVRMRPSRRAMEVIHERNLASPHFDSRALGDARMRESRLRSSEVPPKGVQLVGVVDSAAGILHVAPLTSLQVMRPDITYLDAALKTPPEGLSMPSRHNASQPVKVQTQFRRRDPSTFKAAEAYRRTTWAYHVAQDEADPWVDLDVHGPSSLSARAVRSELTAPPPPPSEASKEGGAQDGAIDLTLDDVAAGAASANIGIADYLRLVSGSRSSATEAPGVLGATPAIATQEASGSLVPGHSALSMTQIAQRSVPVQIEDGLRRAHVLPFRRIIELSSSAKTLPEIFDACKALGRLVRGHWVLRSEVYFGIPWHVRENAAGGAAGQNYGGAGSSSSGKRGAGAQIASLLSPAAITRMSAARDYCLVRFQASPTGVVELNDVCTYTGLSKSAAISILEKLGELVDEGEYAAVGLVGAPAELASALAGPTIANGNVHMTKRRTGLRGGELSPSYCFKQIADDTFTSRYPAEAERQHKWWDKRANDLSVFFASSTLARVDAEGAEEMVAADDVMSSVAPPTAASSATTKAIPTSTVAESDALIGCLPFSPAPRPEAGVAIIRSLDSPTVASLEQVVGDVLLRAGVLSLSALRDRVESISDVPAPSALFRAIATVDGASASSSASSRAIAPTTVALRKSLLLDALRVLLADVGGAQVPVSGAAGDDRYIRRSTGVDETVDAHRRVTVRLLASRADSKGPPVKRADVIAAIRTATGDPDLELQPSQWTRLMKEIAESAPGGAWALKSGRVVS